MPLFTLLLTKLAMGYVMTYGAATAPVKPPPPPPPPTCRCQDMPGKSW
jgi:hypothetical protein